MRKLEVNNIKFHYDDKVILNQASLTATEGSIVGLLGANGSGKTTFFDIICGLKRTKSGCIENNFRRISYLSQLLNTPPALRMHEIFKMIIALSSNETITKADALSRLCNWCPSIMSQYEKIWNKKSSTCSYGETRYFFTLSLLATSSDFIILDEPTAGVDPEFRRHIWQCFHAASQEGLAILVSSHDVEEITRNCSYFYMISNLQFDKFSSSSEFINRYGATNVNDAFIKAVTNMQVY